MAAVTGPTLRAAFSYGGLLGATILKSFILCTTSEALTARHLEILPVYL